MTGLEYRFVRLRVTAVEAVSETLNLLAADGWAVVSHAEADGEYSFVLSRPIRVRLPEEGQ